MFSGEILQNPLNTNDFQHLLHSRQHLFCALNRLIPTFAASNYKTNNYMKRTLFSLFVVMMATCLWAQNITETKNV